MHVKIVSITQSLVAGINSAEDLIVYAARVSNPENQMNTETAPRLLNYLIKHGHWSPFEQASFAVEITTSRAIAAQILRHKTMFFQEFSQRYSSASSIEPLEMRLQAEKNRQSSAELADLNDFQYALLNERVKSHFKASEELYVDLMASGIAREVARGVMPLNTSSTLYVNGTVRSWIHYLSARLHPTAQKEHREVAEKCLEYFRFYFPNLTEALQWNQ